MTMSLRERIRCNYLAHRTGILTTFFVCLFLFIYLLPNIVIFVEAGRKGVRFSRFGHGVQLNRIYGEGPNVIWPWDTMTIYDVRINQASTQFSLLTVDGLTVHLDVAIRYYPARDTKLAHLHQEIGPEYFARIIEPEVQATLRKRLGQFTPHQIYRSQLGLTTEAQAEVAERLAKRYIILDGLLIKSVELPPSVQNAIQSKLVAEQAAQEMAFRIQREIREKTRKKIEAEGLGAYNQIVGESLTQNGENILRFKSIEAFLELAKYGNSNTIVFGSPGSLPLVMNLGGAAMPPATAAPTPASPSGAPSVPSSATPVPVTPSPTPTRPPP